jgi:hypothetical protein
MDIKNEMDPNVLMIMWMLHTSPHHVAEGFIFVDLTHFNAKREFPEMIFVVIVDL